MKPTRIIAYLALVMLCAGCGGSNFFGAVDSLLRQPTRLVLAGPSQVAQDSCAAYSLSLGDDLVAAIVAPVDVTVALSVAGAAGTLYADAGCGRAITSVTLATGALSTTFYFRASGGPSASLGAAFARLAPASLPVTISTSGTSGLSLSLASASPSTGRCLAIQLSASPDGQKETAASTVYVRVLSGPGALFSESSCQSPLSSVVVQPGASTTFYYYSSAAGTATLSATSGALGAKLTFAVSGSGGWVQMKASGPSSNTAGTCSSAYSVVVTASGDGSDRLPSTVSLTGVGSATVFTAAGCANESALSPTAGTVTLTLSQSRTATFYLSDATVESLVLNFSLGTLASASLKVSFTSPIDPTNNPISWTSLTASSSVNAPGTTTSPAARVQAVTWTDAAGRLWLFGGQDGSGLYCNDLWKFDRTAANGGGAWQLVLGDGCMAVFPAHTNMPIARSAGAGWVDASSGNLWLFGGGYLRSGSDPCYLSDLWKYDGQGWTLVSGGTTCNVAGSLGGTGADVQPARPGGRMMSAAWRDSAGNAWLFGGVGADTSGALGVLGDLWRFDGTWWKLVGGASLVGGFTTGWPTPRQAATAWIDGSDTMWLFGGVGLVNAAGASTTPGLLSDLWKYSAGVWTLVAGSTGSYTPGAYGTQGIPSSTNLPGARQLASGWVDSTGALILYGGIGLGETGTSDVLADAWRFSGGKWTWIGGSKTRASVSYAQGSTTPGSRYGAAAWRDGRGSFFLFGGYGFLAGTPGTFNDLWSFNR